MTDLLVVTDANLEDAVLKSERPVVVAIGASWCPDCRRAEPFYMQLASAYGDRAVFTRCNSEDNPEVVRHFEVQHIPTMVVVKNGKTVDAIVEVKTPSALREFFERNL